MFCHLRKFSTLELKQKNLIFRTKLKKSSNSNFLISKRNIMLSNAVPESTEWNLNSFWPSNEKGYQQGLNPSIDDLIFSNTPFPKDIMRFWKFAKTKYCLDGAANRLYNSFQTEEERKQFIPDIIIGDFDSLDKKIGGFYESKGTKIMKQTSQDDTDLEKCLNHVTKNSKETNKKILLCGGLGGNLSQELANLSSLFQFLDCKIFVLTDFNLALVLKSGLHTILLPNGSTVGMFPLGNVCKYSQTDGLKWNLKSEPIQFGRKISSSNVVDSKEGKVYIDISDPVLFTCDFKQNLA